MKLVELGWEKYVKNSTEKIDIPRENIARIAVENRGSYLLYSEMGELEGIVRGKFMNDNKLDKEYPKVGDWVVIEKLQGEQKAVITSVLPRISKLSRKKAGDDLEEQIIASNIQTVFIVQGLDGDFNVSRLERYVALAKEGNCKPVILLNKCDIAQMVDEKFKQVNKMFSEIPVFLISAIHGDGLSEIKNIITKGDTLVFVGSSGAGKSTLINRLLGFERQKTGVLREDDSKGKHTTTKRELIVMDSGGLLIDTPGMREIGVWGAEETLAESFDDIKDLVACCKFNDCDHEFSQGCAIIEAVEKGQLDRDRYARFLKIKKELDPLKARNEKNAASYQKRSLRRLIKRPEFRKDR